MKNLGEDIFENFVRDARSVAENNLVICSSGNLSYRLDNDYMLISTTGSWMSELTSDNIAVCKIADGKAVNGKKPSVESRFHRAILTNRPEVNVVLHFQSPFATALACAKQKIEYNIIPEIPFYIGSIGEVPYIDPGSDALADAVAKAAIDHNLIMLKNHGQVVIGSDFREALQRAMFFEFAAKIIVNSAGNVASLSKEATDYLLSANFV